MMPSPLSACVILIGQSQKKPPRVLSRPALRWEGARERQSGGVGRPDLHSRGRSRVSASCSSTFGQVGARGVGKGGRPNLTASEKDRRHKHVGKLAEELPKLSRV